MDASQKPQMTREMVMRLSGPRNGSIDGFKAYGLTERSLKANRQRNLDRRYVKNYRASMVANSSAGVRRFGAEIGAASGAGANNSSPSLVGGNHQINSTALGRGGGESLANSRQSFNAASSQTVFREPPSRGYNPFS